MRRQNQASVTNWPVISGDFTSATRQHTAVVHFLRWFFIAFGATHLQHTGTEWRN